MKENWENHWKNYYKVLQVDPSAQQEIIKVAYNRFARKYHPDLNKDPATVEKMKEINEAYEILSDPEKRKRYDSAPLKKEVVVNVGQEPSTASKSKHSAIIRPKFDPHPVIEPRSIRFDGVKPGEIRKASFIARNDGGHYRKMLLSEPPPWIKIVNYASIGNKQRLPLKVDIEVQGEHWGTHIDQITIMLDNVAASVRIELRMQPRPKKRIAFT